MADPVEEYVNKFRKGVDKISKELGNEYKVLEELEGQVVAVRQTTYVIAESVNDAINKVEHTKQTIENLNKNLQAYGNYVYKREYVLMELIDEKIQELEKHSDFTKLSAGEQNRMKAQILRELTKNQQLVYADLEKATHEDINKMKASIAENMIAVLSDMNSEIVIEKTAQVIETIQEEKGKNFDKFIKLLQGIISAVQNELGGK